MVQSVDIKSYATQVRASITRPANTTAYTANDVVSDATGDAHYTFSDMANVGRQTGEIVTAKCISSGNESTLPDCDLYLYDTDIADVADNAAFAATDAENLRCVGVLNFAQASWKSSGASSICELKNVGLQYKCLNKNLQLFGQLVMRNAYTPISAEVFTVVLDIIRD